MISAGYSDKYGRVDVERVGNAGFEIEEAEPVALFRAQDELALDVLRDYLARSEADPRVPATQVASVRRQVARFEEWRAAHPGRIRTPGTPREGQKT